MKESVRRKVLDRYKAIWAANMVIVENLAVDSTQVKCHSVEVKYSAIPLFDLPAWFCNVMSEGTSYLVDQRNALIFFCYDGIWQVMPCFISRSVESDRRSAEGDGQIVFKRKNEIIVIVENPARKDENCPFVFALKSEVNIELFTRYLAV